MAAPGAAYVQIFVAAARATAASLPTEDTLRVQLCDSQAAGLARDQTVLNYAAARGARFDAEERECDG